MAKTFTTQQLEDVVKGATILGSGGGGDVAIGKKLLQETLQVKQQFHFVQPEEVKDDEFIAVISGMGSPVATKQRGFDLEQCVVAFEKLEQTVGKKITHVTALETGGGNFIPPLYVAAKRNLTIVDGDGVGRAIPELYMSMFNIKAVNPSPFAMADLDGNAAVLFIDDDIFCEQVGRAIVTKMGGVAGVANYLMSGAQGKSTLIPGTYSRAEKVGRAVRTAMETGQDPVAAVLEVEEGVELIRGTITKMVSETTNAHDFGYHVIEGTEQYREQRLTIHFKNENMLAIDHAEKMRAMPPDLICVFQQSGEPLTNADIEEGMEVICLGIKSHPRWRNEQGFAVFKDIMHTFKYEGPYIALEELNK